MLLFKWLFKDLQRRNFVYTEDAYDNPWITLSTPEKNLEVLCEIMVDFQRIKYHDFNLLPAVKFQGWEKFFDSL